ncbi:MAG: hypothetical protein HW398_836, partial [Acidobacteria bacterium]|nr:hypothetical protein [Acidobacteriota bacterium]
MGIKTRFLAALGMTFWGGETIQLQPQVVGVQAHEAPAALDLAGEAVTENCKAARSLPHAGQHTASSR